MTTNDNNAARSAILGKIRRSISGGASDADRSTERKAVEARLAEKAIGLIPARAQIDREEQIKMFLAFSQAVSSSTDRLASYDDVPSAICAYLRQHNLPQQVRSGSDPRLAAINWAAEPQLERLIGPSDGKDAVGVSHALGGVAETGTALLVSGPDNPTTLNFLPETHIIVVNADDITGDYETLQARLYGEDGEAVMPRVVNRITGPSRSGDIEQVIMLGAHGPRDVHVIVVG
ncbi:L-lactate dehydrogenase complex protein LldG [Cohaesibacter sp. ES.047]|uniref:LutC/YkgG family protein n=1 Tax=Cohaesibacter sp. ES.047 TaxID=1798205 RepID=UPI000BB899C6|nr:LUD domain-containing protein [Cohaesibacter sp. ES.047]SNY92075.1 L-lactate dehydrogenase complex protein LldG [Cohaesibacter sp. ES.047]